MKTSHIKAAVLSTILTAGLGASISAQAGVFAVYQETANDVGRSKVEIKLYDTEAPYDNPNFAICRAHNMPYLASMIFGNRPAWIGCYNNENFAMPHAKVHIDWVSQDAKDAGFHDIDIGLTWFKITPSGLATLSSLAKEWNMNFNPRTYEFTNK